ncbi:GNAT family N-acetyltransferase [Crossiella sp. SN42]|uniref:GNAT family N-acetyltransferase n=1 Tax=Crossiella sp. SN42 TaxID=2944808 RepID=UPI00207CB9E0|nr:GNAT family N-acetyltransferase [Crossiella sp. SN42]MCO1581281.1 GNAT family N-acetyltransferase [Crossiella sp. SN42]
MTPEPVVRPRGDAFDAAVETLAVAYLDDPLVSWLFPEPTSRLRFQRGFIRFLLAAGEAELETTAEGAAVALWLTVEANGEFTGLTADELTALHASFGPAAHRLAELGGEFTRRHPHGERHLYLPLIGVLPEARGQGHGSLLLRHRLARTRLPAYLEASTGRGVALYARHGFVPLGEPIRLAGGPDCHPMWRPAE